MATKDTNLNIRIEQVKLDTLRAVAYEAGVSQSDLIRQGIDSVMEAYATGVPVMLVPKSDE